ENRLQRRPLATDRVQMRFLHIGKRFPISTEFSSNKRDRIFIPLEGNASSSPFFKNRKRQSVSLHLNIQSESVAEIPVGQDLLGGSDTNHAAIEKDDAAAIKGALERLTSAQHKMAETLYQQSAPGAGPSAGPGPEAGAGAPKGDVIDAEVVDEGKK
ncbi:MAG: hypothetical protein AABY89_05680, partial [Acidobacteriota bacterium]